MRPCAENLEAEMSETELGLLLDIIYKYNGKRAHVEIGTAAGGTLWRMIKCFKKNNTPPFVVVDPMSYFDNQLEIVKSNLVKNGVNLEIVEFRQMLSSQALLQARKKGERFSFILIDGHHKIRYVMADLMWGDLIEEGGILCLHDYSEMFPGVVKSVDWFLKKNSHYKREGQAESLLILRKEKAIDESEVGLCGIFYAWCWAPYFQLLPSIVKRVRFLKNAFISVGGR